MFGVKQLVKIAKDKLEAHINEQPNQEISYTLEEIKLFLVDNGLTLDLQPHNNTYKVTLKKIR